LDDKALLSAGRTARGDAAVRRREHGELATLVGIELELVGVQRRAQQAGASQAHFRDMAGAEEHGIEQRFESAGVAAVDRTGGDRSLHVVERVPGSAQRESDACLHTLRLCLA
jgi:hypothetical protein